MNASGYGEQLGEVGWRLPPRHVIKNEDIKNEDERGIRQRYEVHHKNGDLRGNRSQNAVALSTGEHREIPRIDRENDKPRAERKRREDTYWRDSP